MKEKTSFSIYIVRQYAQYSLKVSSWNLTHYEMWQFLISFLKDRAKF